MNQTVEETRLDIEGATQFVLNIVVYTDVVNSSYVEMGIAYQVGRLSSRELVHNWTLRCSGQSS